LHTVQGVSPIHCRCRDRQQRQRLFQHARHRTSEWKFVQKMSNWRRTLFEINTRMYSGKAKEALPMCSASFSYRRHRRLS
jgi:hypothetical protein